MRGYTSVLACSEFPHFNHLDSLQTAFKRLHLWSVTAAISVAHLATPMARAASFETDANGFVVMEAENFDLNVTQTGGEWRFDNTALAFDPYSGWGYMKALFSGGTDTNLSPRLDYKVNFTAAGTYYIWVSGSDAGGKSMYFGLNGVVPATADNIGGADAAFGARFGGELWWLSNYNDGSGYTPGHRPYLTIPSPGEYTVNVFIRDVGFYLDRICLTTDMGFVPTPLFGGSTSGLNLPAQTVSSSPGLAVTMTQPANGQTLYGGPSNSVPIVAKPATNGTSVTKIEFFSRLVSAGSFAKIGEATAKPYMMIWSNSPSGSNLLMAVVTDSIAQKATSAVINVSIALPPTFLTPLKWTTNNFDSGLGSFTLQSQNHAGGFDIDWKNSTNAGGPPGELGGYFTRRSDITPYVAEPLSRPVTLNEDLWFKGSMMFSNINANGDTFVGYFDTNSLARFGLKIREPSGSAWRFRVEPGNLNMLSNPTLPNQTVGQFELHWIPSGLGDGSGSMTGMVAGVAFTVSDPIYSTPNAASFNAFGRLVPAQGSIEDRACYQYVDNLAYVIPATPVLNIQAASGNKVLLSWDASGYLLQYQDGALTGPNWQDYNTNSVVQLGGSYFATNSIGTSNRWYRLRHPL